jgi:hypothetical protein
MERQNFDLPGCSNSVSIHEASTFETVRPTAWLTIQFTALCSTEGRKLNFSILGMFQYLTYSSLISCSIKSKIGALDSHLNSAGDANLSRMKMCIFALSRTGGLVLR